MIPFDITYSTHTSRNAGRRTSSSVDFNAGGVHIGWMHPFESAAQQKVVEYAREAGHKISGSKHHDSWRIECADAACLHLWGTTVWDEITRAVMIEKPVHYAPSNPGYIVREGKLLEFYHSRCRDRTWTRALRLKECPPRAAPRARVEWRCEAARVSRELSGAICARSCRVNGT